LKDILGANSSIYPPVQQASTQVSREPTSTQTSDPISQWTHVSKRLFLHDASAVKGRPHPVRSKPQFCGPVIASKATPGASINWMPPLRPDLFNIETLHNLPPRGSSASKIASKYHHNLREKHRRDNEFAFVIATNILYKGLDPGILSGCAICAADADNQDSWIHHCGTATTEQRPGQKKTKNGALEDILKVLFSTLLHLWPSELGRQLDKVRAEARHLARDREIGLQSNPPKTSRLSSNIAVYEQLISTIEMQYHKHSINPSGSSYTGGFWESSLLPPKTSQLALGKNSCTSPKVGQKRARII
jgi:hypothetical protein